jgi:tRNA (cytidine/uridine-2'-O-)-methyltransferase
MRLALYEPDIPQNAGAMIRLAACLDADLEIIEPCGFLLDDRRLDRAALDYRPHCRLTRHRSWAAFQVARAAGTLPGRLVLLTTRASQAHQDFAFQGDDILLLGRESAGVPEAVHAAAEARVRVPLRPGLRSLNLALAAALVLGEALRQTGGFTRLEPAA